MKAKFLLLAVLTTLASSPILADECSVTISSNDAMQFDKKAITINKACKKFSVTLKHTGTTAKAAMGHNWVLSKTEEAQAVATDGLSAGIDSNYLKPGDARVIAATKLIGGGETTSVEVPLNKLSKNGNYTFFCSFPGHIALMKGTLTLE
ncbi:MAG TPA: azurin [Cellvibrio sp.]|nr:azurin [Cellvibrio sp.]